MGPRKCWHILRWDVGPTNVVQARCLVMCVHVQMFLWKKTVVAPLQILADTLNTFCHHHHWTFVVTGGWSKASKLAYPVQCSTRSCRSSICPGRLSTSLGWSPLSSLFSFCTCMYTLSHWANTVKIAKIYSACVPTDSLCLTKCYFC